MTLLAGAELRSACRDHIADETVDKTDFRRRARLMQALWREEQGLPIGTFRGKPRGANVELEHAKRTLCNYMAETTKRVFRDEVEDPERCRGKLYGKPRIYDSLLSSQPLCFNLFAHLRQDTGLARRVFAELTTGRITRVERVLFEHSPGRDDYRYTGDRSAADVFVEYATSDRRRRFLAIEVKYHENLEDADKEKSDAAERDRQRACYEELTAEMGCFDPSATQRLQTRPLRQIWRDHMLAGSIVAAGDYDGGSFVFLYARDNEDCARAVGAYRECLVSDASFADWTLEDLVAAIERHAGADRAWIDAVHRRYLDFERLASRL